MRKPERPSSRRGPYNDGPAGLAAKFADEIESRLMDEIAHAEYRGGLAGIARCRGLVLQIGDRAGLSPDQDDVIEAVLTTFDRLLAIGRTVTGAPKRHGKKRAPTCARAPK